MGAAEDYLAALTRLARLVNPFYGHPTGLVFDPRAGLRRAVALSEWGPDRPSAERAAMQAALDALPAAVPVDLPAVARCHPTVAVGEELTLAPLTAQEAEAAVLQHLTDSWNQHREAEARAAVRALVALGPELWRLGVKGGLAGTAVLAAPEDRSRAALFFYEGDGP